MFRLVYYSLYSVVAEAELILTWLGGVPDPLANHFEIVSCHKMFSESLGQPMELPENAWKAMARGHPDNLQTILKMISAVDRIESGLKTRWSW